MRYRSKAIEYTPQNKFYYSQLKKILPVLFTVLLFVVAMAMMPVKNDNPVRHYSIEELKNLHAHALRSPIDSGEYFLTPDNCRGCHGFDSAGVANLDTNGIDINLYDDWETSMMGLSGIDPLWKAKVSHEIITNPAHSNELQTFCTSCHAPMGHYTAKYKGYPHYLLANVDTDKLGRAGVSCMGCHAIGDSALGIVFSGVIPYDTNRVIYGPYTNPMPGPMQLYTGFTPTFGDHMGEGKLCSSCHTLISNTVDLTGNPTGGTFIEQATFHEWENSVYPNQNIICQTCHMPPINEPIVIANGIISLQPRSPFNLHQFAGANSFMVNLIKTNKTSLGVLASDANFDSTLVAIDKQLTKNTLTVSTHADTFINDTASISVTLTNKAGHKFPTGYPSRRAVLQLIVTKPNGDTLFASGLFDPNHEVINIATPFEPHHDTINTPTRAQVYEMVMGDVNGNKTTVLERSAISLKDNRIPPLGFTTQFSTYDTCKITGSAFADADFNKTAGTEGTGADIVHYQVALQGYHGLINIKASVYYQTVPPAWLAEMFSNNSAQIDTFRNMFNNAPKAPLLVAIDSLQNIQINTGINNASAASAVQVYPTITQSGKVTITGTHLNNAQIKVYTERGQLISVSTIRNEEAIQLQLPQAGGVYLINVSTSQFNVTRKVFKL